MYDLSHVHYYTHGRIGPYVVEKPMVLGHEASGVITKVGKNVTHLNVGDRVCIEPGIPRFDSPETLAGCYNLDSELTFFATPPIDGCYAKLLFTQLPLLSNFLSVSSAITKALWLSLLQSVCNQQPRQVLSLAILP